MVAPLLARSSPPSPPCSALSLPHLSPFSLFQSGAWIRRTPSDLEGHFQQMNLHPVSLLAFGKLEHVRNSDLSQNSLCSWHQQFHHQSRTISPVSEA
ncbi:hypothetical protein ILYODFUR_021724, partial [Ilyodon furcidens]